VASPSFSVLVELKSESYEKIKDSRVKNLFVKACLKLNPVFELFIIVFLKKDLKVS
jgi:hypothetical protein